MFIFKKNRKSGFTLIELLVVISIISVLSAIVLASINSARTKATTTRETLNVMQLAKAINLSITDGSYPSSGGTWQCVGISTGKCWNNFYFPAVTLNNALVGNISTTPIPGDPEMLSNSFYYAYNANYTSGAAPFGPGAYLMWFVRDIGNTSCGSAFVFAISISSGVTYRQCLMKI